MRAAVLLVGQMRTWETCLHTFKWHVARHFDHPLDFYISTVDDDQAESAKLTDKHFPGSLVRIDVKTQPTIPEPHEPVRFEPYARSVPVQGVLRQLWQLNEAWKFFVNNDGREYDIVIRSRPDLFFHSFQMPDKRMSQYAAYTPWWGRFGGVNDRFAVLGWSAARAYFETFANMDDLLRKGCPLHPESLVAASMWDYGCAVHTNLKAEFSTLRMNGEMRQPEIGPIDLAHAGMRVLTPLP